GPQVGPSLTAAARDGRIIVRAGTEEWFRRGPNKRMAPNMRAKCRQTRYPDPKPSTVHQTGASPIEGYRCLSLMRAVAVVKCQLALVCRAFRLCFQAVIFGRPTRLVA